MRILFLVIAMVFAGNVLSQNDTSNGLFVRIFDLRGEKIAKGLIEELTSEEIVLRTKKLSLRVPVNNIGKIKTGRSGGAHVAIGAGAGISVGVILGIAAGEDGGLYGVTSTGEQVAAMSVLGGILGSAAGGLSTFFKKSRKFQIQGDPTKWQEFMDWINS